MIGIDNYIPINHFLIPEQNGSTCAEVAQKVANILPSSRFQWVYYRCIDLLSNCFAYFKKRQLSEIQDLTSRADLALTQFRSRIDEQVQKNFTISAKNVDHLDEAEVICFGEAHENLTHRINRAALIDTICRDNDLILVERNPNQAEHVQNRLQIQSWDEEKSYDEDDKLLDDFQQIHAKAEKIFKELKSYTKETLSSEIAKRLTEGDLKRYREFLKKTDGEIPHRNRHMHKRIEENLQKSRRIYVIAGALHFAKILGLSCTAQEQLAQKEIMAYLQTKKFAILIPKALSFQFVFA